MGMSKNLVSMKEHFDLYVESFSKRMQEYSILDAKFKSSEYRNMSLEDSSAFLDSYKKAVARYHAASEILSEFVLEHKDHIKFE